MTIIPLHPDPNDDSWDTEDYSLVEKELLPVRITQDAPGYWSWRIDHPVLRDTGIGPFPSGRAAFRHMKQFKNSTAPAEVPSEIPGIVAMGAVDATAEKLVMEMLDSPDPAVREKARGLIEKHSYD